MQIQILVHAAVSLFVFVQKCLPCDLNECKYCIKIIIPPMCFGSFTTTVVSQMLNFAPSGVMENRFDKMQLASVTCFKAGFHELEFEKYSEFDILNFINE